MSYKKTVSTIKRTAVHILVLCILFGCVTPPALAADDVAEVLVHEESFVNDHTMKGLFSSFTETFATGDWEIESAKLTLVMAATPLVRQEVSDFTLSINGRAFHSSRIPITDGKTVNIQVDIPIDSIVQGTNSLFIESYLRTNETDPCAEEVGSCWLNIFKDSFVSLKYKTKAKLESVRDLYTQVTSIDALENNQSTIFTSAAGDDVTLSTTAYVLSGISRNAARFYENMGLLRVTKAEDFKAAKYGIYISMLKDLLPEVSGQLDSKQLQAAKSDALIANVLVGETHLLLITADKSDMLLKSGQLLGNPKYVGQTAATWRKIATDEIVTYEYDTADDIRLLTEVGTYIKGPFRQEASFYLQNPPNRILDGGSRVCLEFRYSENINFDRSLVTVYLNDVPVDSKKLSRDGASGDLLVVNLPTNQNIVGNVIIRVAFDLEIADLECTLRQEQMPWAYISQDSTVEMHTRESPYMLFDYFPSPFVEIGYNNVAVVLPENPGEADLEVMRHAMLTMGRYLNDNTGNLRVCTPKSIGKAKNENLIVIGTYKNNSIIQTVNEKLFFKFSTDGKTILSNEKKQIEPSYGATLGTSQLLYSPYSTENALMVITGVTDKGMLSAADYLGNTDMLWQVVGDGFITNGTQTDFYRFKEENNRLLSPGERLLAAPGLMYGIIATAAVLLLLFIAIIVLLIKYKKKKR